VISRSNVSYPSNVLRQALASPPFASKQEFHLWRECGSLQEKLFDSGFAVRQPISDKREIASQSL
jgi:hypothetical protein